MFATLLVLSLVPFSLSKSTTTSGTSQFKRVCYLTVDHYPFNAGITDIHNFDADFCTHINFMPVVPNASTLSIEVQKPTDAYLIQEIHKLRLLNPNLKILATLIENGSKEMGVIASSKSNRQNFSENVVSFLEEHGFDGLDLDWEFPAYTSMKMSEKVDCALLLEQLNYSFKWKDPQRKKYLLSIAVAADHTIIDVAYDSLMINEHVDYVNLMAYALNDWHCYWPFTGFNAPLYRETSLPYFSKLNVAYAANLWHSLGVAKDKIVVGIPTYSHTFRLITARLHGPGAPATRELQEFSYSDVCKFLKQKETTRVWDKEAQVPYAYNETIWVTYEDEESAKRKAQFVRDNGYGGVMTYNINNDDIFGSCRDDPYDTFLIHRVLKETLP